MPSEPIPTSSRVKPVARLRDACAGLWIGLFALLLASPARVSAQATNRWTGGGDGTTWNLAANWQLGRVPTATDMAVIDLNGTNTVVRITGTSATVRSLVSSATLVIDGGELAVSQGTNHLRGPLHASLSSIGASGNGTWLVATNTTTLTGTSLNAVGGAILRLTGARRFITGNQVNASIVARNPGSGVELPNVTELEGATGQFRSLTVHAINGGWIQLGSVPRVEIGYTSFAADGAGSIIDLGALERMSGGELFARGGGLLLTPILQRLELTSVTVDGIGSGLDLTLVDAIPGCSVRVAAGAQVELPGVTALAGGELSSSLVVTGGGSELRFPSVTTLAGAIGRFSRFSVQALQGGALRLPLLTGVTGDKTDFLAEGNDAVLELPALAELNFNTLEARAGAHLDCPSLTTLRSASLTIQGSTTRLPVAQITSADGCWLQALDGAVLRFTGLAGYDALTLGSVRFLATGNGSELSFPKLASLRGTRAQFTTLLVQAGPGSRVRMPVLTNVVDGSLEFLSEGTNALLELDVLPSLSGPALEARAGGTVSVPALKTFRRGSLIVRGAGSILPVAQITSLDGTSVFATGGAVLRFSNLTAYDALAVGSRELSASEAGSRLEFPALATLIGTASPFAMLSITATGGGVVDMPQLAQVSSPSLRFAATGEGSRVQLPTLADLDGSGFEAETGGTVSLPALKTFRRGSLIVRGAGSILPVAQITSLDGASVVATGGAVLRFDSVTAYDAKAVGSRSLGAFDPGSRLEFPALTTLTGTASPFATLAVEAGGGGVVGLPKLTQVSTPTIRFAATGTGSVVELPILSNLVGTDFEARNGGRISSPALTSLQFTDFAAVGSGSRLDTAQITEARGAGIAALDGARLSFDSLQRYEGGNGPSTVITASGTGSQLEFPVLTELTGTTSQFTSATIRASGGGFITLPELTTLEAGALILAASGPDSVLDLPAFSRGVGISVELSDSAELRSPEWSELYVGRIVLRGDATLDSRRLAVIDGSGLQALDGARLRLEAVQTYQAGTVWAGFSAIGAGSLVELPSLRRISGSIALFTQLSLEALNSGTVRLPLITELEVGTFTARAHDPGSRLDLPSLTSTRDFSFSVFNGGTLSAPGLRSLTGGHVDLYAQGIWTTEQIRSLRNVSVALNGATASFPNLTDAGTASFTVRNGGNAILPPAADLQVTTIGLPTTGRAGYPLTVTWSVTNASGVAIAGVRLDGFALRRSGVPDLDLGTVEVAGDLAARSARTHQATLILPGDLTGTWRLVVTADAGFGVFEGDRESNNSRVSAGELGLSSPDLAVTSVLPTIEPIVAGVPFELTWVVQNSGTTNATAPWADGLVLGTNSTDFTSGLILGTQPRPAALVAGARYTNRVQAVVPLDPARPPGDYFLAVVANADHAQPEVTEANNLASRAVQLVWPPLPDLVPLRVAGPSLARPSTSVTVSYAVTNLGPANAVGPWTETVYLQASDALAGATRLLGSFRVEDPLPAHSVQDRSREVALPADLPPSTNARWLVVVNPEPGPVEITTANNSATGSTAVTIPASLTLDLAQSRVREDAGTLIARLQRNGPLENPLNVQWSALPAGRIGAPSNLHFAAGQAELTLTLPILPDGLVRESGPIALVARAAGFTDGTATVVVDNTDAAQLTLQFATNQVRQGQSVAATITRNAGLGAPLALSFNSSMPGRLLPPANLTLAAGQTSAVVAWIALDDVLWSPAETVAASVGAPGFPVATAAVTVVEIAPPALTLSLSRNPLKESDGPLATIATVTRSGRLDTPLLVALTSTNTNAVVVPAFVTIPAGTNQTTFAVGTVARPSLSQDQVTELRAFPTYTLTSEPFGEPARAAVTVLDTDRPALALELSRAVVAPNRSPAAIGTVRRATATASALTVTLGQSVAGLLGLPSSVVIPANADAVEFPINTMAAVTGDDIRTTRITASAAALVPADAGLTVSARQFPDLIVESVAGPVEALTLANASLVWRIRNQGLADHTGRILQRVYLSTDGQLDSDDALVAEQSIEGQFAVGSFVGVARTLFLPAQPGDYWVFVQLVPEGALTEVSNQNNLGRSAAPIRVRPAYSVASLELSPASAPAGEPVEIRGRLLRPDGTPAAFEIAAIYVRRDGSERPVAGLSDETGLFYVTFRPGRTEAGVFEVAADHPEVIAPPTRLQFVRHALVPDPVNPLVTIISGGQRTLRVNLSNPGPTPLTGLEARGDSLPAGASLRPTLPSVIPAGARIAVDLEFLAGDAAVGITTPTILVTSIEGARLEVPLTLRIQPPVPQVEVIPSSILAGAVRGQPARLSIAVTNTGALATRPLTVVLPDVPRLADTTPGARASLAPGEGTTFDLTFTSTPDQALGEYQGDILVVGDGFQSRIPFSVRLVSAAVGDLEVLAEDEFTYYAADAPKLAGARVEVLDPYTSAPLASAITDAAGLARIPSLAEGPYRLRVSADRHFSREVPVTIQPGITQRTRVLVPVEGVAYS